MHVKVNRRLIELVKDALIVLLLFSAAYLIGRSHLYEGFQSVVLNGAFGDRFSGVGAEREGSTDSSVLQPNRLAVHNLAGRYGVQYDSTTVDTLFDSKLGSLLGEALDRAAACVPIPEEVWQTALTAWTPSVYYEFPGRVSLKKLSARLGDGKENQQLQGELSRLLLVVREDGTAILCYQNEQDGLYYGCALPDTLVTRLKDVASGFAPNDALFAFEVPERYALLPPTTLVLSTHPQLPVYQTTNPLENLKESGREELLRAFSFHPQTAALYQAVDGFVVREGGDSLRITNAGTVTFHGAQQQEQGRYEPDAAVRSEPLEAAQRILEDVVLPECGEARFCYLGTTQGEAGQETLSFAYELEGVPVCMEGRWAAAEFTFQNAVLTGFSIRFRQYTALETLSVLLPEEQAVTALRAMSGVEQTLLLCYADEGKEQTVAMWMTQGA